MGWAIGSLIVSIVSAAVSAYSQYEAAQQQQGAQRYQAKLAENQAKAARDQAAVAAEESRQRTAKIIALTHARANASGVVSTEGTPLLVQMENTRQAEWEAELIRSGGEQTAAAFQDESRLFTFRGRQLRAAGTIGAGTTLLSGVGNALSQYANRRPSETPAPTPDTEYIQQ
jgi:hypothetical protein